MEISFCFHIPQLHQIFLNHPVPCCVAESKGLSVQCRVPDFKYALFLVSMKLCSSCSKHQCGSAEHQRVQTFNDLGNLGSDSVLRLCWFCLAWVIRSSCCFCEWYRSNSAGLVGHGLCCPRWPQDNNKETLWIWSQYVILSVHHPAHFHSILFCLGKIFWGVSDADRRTDIDILPWTHHLFLGLQLKSCKKEEKACGGPGRSCILPLNLPSLWRWHRWFWWGSDQFICPQVSPEAHVSS